MALVAVLLASVVLAGCGGGGGGERLSKAAVTKRAEAVCAEGKKESDRLREQAQIGARGEAAGEEIDATRAALEAQIDGFADLRGPASTDDDIAALLKHLRAASAGLEDLKAAAVDGNLTVDDAISANPELIQQINRSGAQAADDLVALGWLTCIGVAS